MKTNYFFLLLTISIAQSISALATRNHNSSQVWSHERVNEWYSVQPWLAGCNFQPSTAINQVEMWAADTYDPKTIDKELSWAEELGFNTMRVFLSSEVWRADANGFKARIENFLTICNKHNIKPAFVFFDDCWNEETTPGKQPAPKAGVHNSGWVQDPACSLRADTVKLFPVLERYVKDILSTYKSDKRILFWDLYNEPGNSKHGIASLPLLRNVFKWSRQINPVQPLTSGLWNFGYPELNIFQIENSDIISYHNYSDVTDHYTWINLLRVNNRPLICTEYMARKSNSRFQNIMPLLKQYNVGAINWGFVSGKTNTIFAWDDPLPNTKEPTLWFHDIYRVDKTPFDPAEEEVIKKLTNRTTNIKLIPECNFEKTIDGKKVALYTLRNKFGMVTQITNFGGRVVNLWVPDRDNNFKDIVTGFNTIDGYLTAREVYFGALIGRFGNRIANSKFMLNGKQYLLPVNDGVNQLHGGPKGFHNVVWDARRFKNELNEEALELKYLSPDGDQGYPGNLQVKVIYTLTNNNELKIEYAATTDKPTVINLTHHSFFNLHGFSDGVAKTVNTHILKINGLYFTPTDSGLIPTGQLATVKNTPMDFTYPTSIGKNLNNSFEALTNGKGFDHNWVLDKHGDKITEAAVIYEPETGIQMSIMTDQPALQFYGGNFFEGKDTGKYGEVYTYRTSVALETQHFPDSPNQLNFPSVLLNPADKYTHLCVYQFGVRK